MIKNKNGDIVSKSDQLVDRWAENRIEEDVNFLDTIADEREKNNFPTEEEVSSAIQKLKNNKSPGADSIPPEILKHGGKN